MKILVCVSRLDRGGAELLECRLAAQFNRAGVTAHLLGQYSPAVFDGEERAAYWKAQGVPKIHWLDFKKGVKMLHRYYQFCQLIKQEKYDVIISTNAGSQMSVAFCHKFCDFQHVAGFHDYSYKTNINPVKFILWKLAVRSADKYYFISKKVQNNINALFGLRFTKGKVIYNSIEIPDVGVTETWDVRKELGLSADHKLILSIGRITKTKGFDIGIDIIKNHLKSNDAAYIILGDVINDDSYLKELMRQICDLGLEGKVFHLGFRKNVFDILKQADLLLHIARHEGFGLVLIEGIAGGLPIVASNAGGIPEVLDKTPYKCFDPAETDLILAEVTRYLNMPANEKNELLDQARSVLPYFSDERRALEIYDLIKM